MRRPGSLGRNGGEKGVNNMGRRDLRGGTVGGFWGKTFKPIGVSKIPNTYETNRDVK